MYKDNQDRIDAYLRGEMTSEERFEFEKDKDTNMALRQEYLETKAIADALADRKEKLDMMAHWDMEEELRLKILHRRMLIRRWTIGFSAAACLAIGFFAVRPMFLTTTSVPGNNFVMPDFSQETYYRGGNSDIEMLDSVISSRDYAKALALSNSLINENRLEIAQYEQKDSLTVKDSYRKLQYENNLYDLEWRRVNLLLALNQKEEAKALLKEFVYKEGVYKNKADSIFKTLNQ